jgi:DNA-directed RNA polymerase specialized sigma24 family protein
MADSEILQRLDRIETALQTLITQRTVKDYYTTAEAAELLGKSEFTVREWCRLGRVNAEKRACGRGASQEWIVSAAELDRIRNEGLLPDANRYRHFK